MIEAGKTYCGKDRGGRRLVVAVDGDTVRYLLPLSLREGTVTVAEFEDWAEEEFAPAADSLYSGEPQS